MDLNLIENAKRTFSDGMFFDKTVHFGQTTKEKKRPTKCLSVKMFISFFKWIRIKCCNFIRYYANANG